MALDPLNEGEGQGADEGILLVVPGVNLVDGGLGEVGHDRAVTRCDSLSRMVCWTRNGGVDTDQTQIRRPGRVARGARPSGYVTLQP